MKYIVALDQGTTSSRCIVFDTKMNVVAKAQQEFHQIYPQPAWVEHDPYDILTTQTNTLREAVAKAGINGADIECIGIANQRETTVVWEKKTGKPIYNAIVWQCRRTAGLCEDLRRDGLSDELQRRTGLVVDAYFSGTKVKWILDNVQGARAAADKGELAFGTVDSWLLWNLTAQRHHLTDVTNASRTMLYNIETMAWDADILKWLDIPENMLPAVLPCSSNYGTLRRDILGQEIPIRGVAGDQQAALFGQACFHKGDAKNTYGTGCFLLMNTGERPVISRNKLLTTIAWDTGTGPCYALEGSVFMAGAVIQWLRDDLGLIKTAEESEEQAFSIKDTAGVFMVPAFTGLGAPWWDMYARGAILGLTRGTGKAHIVRAALEAIAYQSYDVLAAMEADSGIQLHQLKVDGGASSNQFLMQFQADLLGVPVVRPSCVETTAMGAAYFAGLSSGIFNTTADIVRNWKAGREFRPTVESMAMRARIDGWHKAIDRARNWEIKQ